MGGGWGVQNEKREREKGEFGLKEGGEGEGGGGLVSSESCLKMGGLGGGGISSI